MVDDCVDRLHSDAVVIVDTQRLQHLVADEYNQQMQAAGFSAWKTPEVFTLSTWLRRLWSRYELRAGAAVHTLLSAEQSRQIWERTIAENIRNRFKSGYEYLLWHITATANQVKAAYGLMCSYDIDAGELAGELSADVTNFRIWLNAYVNELERRNCIDHERLADHVGDVIRELMSADGAPAVVFAGIDTWTPQLNRLVDSLKRAIDGVEVLEHRTAADVESAQRFEFRTTAEEIDACARWARVAVEANPERHRIGIVTPNLKEIGPRLSRRLADYLNPDAIMENRQTNNQAFHMTLSGSLSELPVVVDAMNLLELLRPTVSIEVMAAVFRSNRIKGWVAEAAERADFALALYGIGGDRLSIDDVISLATRGSKRCPQFMALLRQAKRLLADQPPTADYAYWGRLFMQWLAIFQSGKKGDHSFGIDERQAYHSWVSIVHSLAELGFVASVCRIETALAKLVRRVGEESVQPRALRTPVQVGEYLSMAGQTFTHLWMLGMNEKSLPGSPHPNPFLPISVQKAHAIPHSSTQFLAEQVHRRYLQMVSGAEHIVQSFALMDGNTPCQRSILLDRPQPFDGNEWEDLSSHRDYLSVISEHYARCTRLNDWRAPPVNTDSQTSGGARLLKNQSNCPFRAFAVHRLHLQELPALEIGVTRLARGLMMHQTMEKLYRDFTTPEALEKLSNSGGLSDIIRKIVRQVVDEYNGSLTRSLSRKIIDVEAAILSQLAKLVVEEFDMKRTAEKIRDNRENSTWEYYDLSHSSYQIWDVEYQTEISLAGMTLGLKIDRIEKWHDEFRLIDYKTGMCDIKDANGHRPRDPQLAVYAVAMHKQGFKIADVGYIQLKDGGWYQSSQEKWHRRLSKSRRESSNALPIRYQLDGRFDVSWLTELESLAANFAAGEALADPLHGACEYCNVTPVCRIKCRSDAVG